MDVRRESTFRHSPEVDYDRPSVLPDFLGVVVSGRLRWQYMRFTPEIMSHESDAHGASGPCIDARVLASLRTLLTAQDGSER